LEMLFQELLQGRPAGVCLIRRRDRRMSPHSLPLPALLGRHSLAQAHQFPGPTLQWGLFKHASLCSRSFGCRTMALPPDGTHRWLAWAGEWTEPRPEAASMSPLIPIVIEQTAHGER